MKKLLSITLCLMLALSMCGFAYGEEAAKWDTSKQDELIVSVMNNYYTQGWYDMAEAYMELHPETTVTIDVIANNDALTQKFTTWMASDDLSDASDVTHINFGNITSMQQKGQCFDFSTILDEINPYTGVAVRDCFEEGDIKSYTNENGVYALPFDHVGVAVMVNVSLLEENGLEVPTTWEAWMADCAALKEAGYETPILATAEATWTLAVLGDAAMRDQVGELIVQPGDGIYDEAVHGANADYVYDPEDLTCDVDVVMSSERVAIYQSEHELDDPIILSVWEVFAEMGSYMNANYEDSSSTEILTSFEMGESAFLISGSWNVGVLNADMLEMGDDAFEWETIAFPDFETAPEGWASNKLRSLYGMGNTMGILITGDEDHTARVVDFMMFVHNPEGCAKMFESTLNAGQFVQGPVAIKGVELPAEITAKLEGFIAPASEKGDFSTIVGCGQHLSEDQGSYRDYEIQMLTGEITAAEFIENIKPLAAAKLADTIEVNGYDLDPTTADTAK